MSSSVSVDTARYTALALSLTSLCIQTIIHLGTEVWRRKGRQVRDSFYNTHWLLLTLHVIFQSIIAAYYTYRCLWEIDEHGAQFIVYLYATMTIYSSIALGMSLMTLMFASIRSIGMNIASSMHCCSLIALAIWLEDPFAVGASSFAAILMTLTSPGTYKLKTQ